WHGAGDSFCAGNDVADFLKSPLTLPSPPGGEGRVRGSGETPQARLMKAFVNFDKPLVAAVHGSAIGGGTTMLTHCDFVYAGESGGRAPDLQEPPEAVGAQANGTGDARRERGLCRPAALAGRQGSTDGVPREAKAGLHEVEGAGDGNIGFPRFNKCGRARRGFSRCPPHEASRRTRTHHDSHDTILDSPTN